MNIRKLRLDSLDCAFIAYIILFVGFVVIMPAICITKYYNVYSHPYVLKHNSTLYGTSSYINNGSFFIINMDGHEIKLPTASTSVWTKDVKK